jgi:hypothetical protein
MRITVASADLIAHPRARLTLGLDRRSDLIRLRKRSAEGIC